MVDIVNEPSDKYRFPTACRSGNLNGKQMYPWHKMIGIGIGIVSVWNPKQTNYWFSKYNRVLLHYSVIIAAAAATAYISLRQRGRRWCISICQRWRRRISLSQRLLGYLVEIPQWERGREKKHPWSTTQHLEQLRSHSKVNHPLSVLWRHFRWRHFRYGKKKSAGMHFRAYAEHTSSYHVISRHVTSCDVISSQGCFRWRHFQ